MATQNELLFRWPGDWAPAAACLSATNAAPSVLSPAVLLVGGFSLMVFQVHDDSALATELTGSARVMDGDTNNHF
jgi:hypothetical protein